MRRNFGCAWTLAVGILAMPAVAAGQTFGYLGDIGPSFWADLSPDWVACGSAEAVRSEEVFT